MNGAYKKGNVVFTKTQRRRNQRKKQKERILQLAIEGGTELSITACFEVSEEVVKAAKKSAKRKKRRNQRKRAKVARSQGKLVEKSSIKSNSSDTLDTPNSFFDNLNMFNCDELPVNDEKHLCLISQWAYEDTFNKESQPCSSPSQTVAVKHEECIEMQYQSVQWPADISCKIPPQSGAWMQPPPSWPVHQQLHQYISLKHEKHEHAFYMHDDNNTIYYEQQQQQEQFELQFLQNSWDEPNSSALQATFELKQQQRYHRAQWYKQA